jgi:hypothetical protein
MLVRLILFQTKNSIYEHSGPAARTYRRRQQPNTFHVTTNSPQNVCCFILFFRFEINLLFLVNTYTCPIIALFVFISYFDHRNIVSK